MDTSTRVKALAEYLEVEADEIHPGHWTERPGGIVELYCVGRDGNHSAEYLVLTDEEADQQAAEYIRETVWAFVPDFLASYVPDGIDADHIESMRGDQCEGFNDAAVALVEAGRGMDQLVKGAIWADGRGHFLATYDGDECQQGDLYIYRTN